MVSPRETALKVLLKQQHLQEYVAFRRAYDRAAATVDRHLVGGAPSKATFYRWLSGSLAHMPHPRHCQVLEALIPGWTAGELLQEWGGDDLFDPESRRRPDERLPRPDRPGPYADLAGVFTSRAEFAHEMPPAVLFGKATEICAAGLSLNVVCQNFGDRELTSLIESRGCSVRLLFLDPAGREIGVREREEGFVSGYLSNLTRANIHIVERLRGRLSPSSRDRLSIRTYDETIRFNITLVDRWVCIFQPYLPDARGLDSPAFVAHKDRVRPGDLGLYQIFEDLFETMWERAKIW